MHVCEPWIIPISRAALMRSLSIDAAVNDERFAVGPMVSSKRLFARLSVCLSVCIYIYLSVYLSICLSIRISVYLSIYLYICLSIYLFIYQSMYIYIHMFVYFLLLSVPHFPPNFDISHFSILVFSHSLSNVITLQALLSKLPGITSRNIRAILEKAGSLRV